MSSWLVYVQWGHLTVSTDTLQSRLEGQHEQDFILSLKIVFQTSFLTEIQTNTFFLHHKPGYMSHR